MRVGLFFGSFNPIHVGHLIIAETVLDLAHLHQVWLVVTPHNPHKDKQSLANDYQRLDLVARATEDNPRLFPCDVEFGMPQPNYTIDTLTELMRRHPGHEFCLLMGEDNLASLPRWKRWEALVAHYDIYVYPRLGQEPATLQGHRIHRVAAPVLELSATEVRRRIQQGLSVRYMLTEPVLDEVERAGMYRL
jgi:nicotinate-nucleotide adenylyltransferase